MPQAVLVALAIWALTLGVIEIIGSIPLLQPTLFDPYSATRLFTLHLPILAYWQRGVLLVFICGTLLILWPKGWQRQQAGLAHVLRLAREHAPLLTLLTGSYLLRVALCWRGGQYFDYDEIRYGSLATNVFFLLARQDLAGALNALLETPLHVGFLVVGLVPAFFHVPAAWHAGVSIADMRVPSGEWVAAAVLALSSVAVIGLVYGLVLRTGGSRNEATIAAVLAATSNGLFLFSRFLLPYDASMALALGALWIALGEQVGVIQGAAAGLAASASFLTYNGSWTLLPIIALASASRASSVPRALACLASFAVAAGSAPLALVALGRVRGIPFLENWLELSKMVTHGDFSSGATLPWAFFWHSEHALLLVWLIGCGAAIWQARTSRDIRRRTLLWGGMVTGLYLLLVLGSNLLERFVVYDRTARLMVPFLCLAAAAGLAPLFARASLPLRSVLIGLLVVQTFLNFGAVLLERFPRDVAQWAVRTLGADQVRFKTTLGEEQPATWLFLPPLQSSSTARYVLVNPTDIWVDDQDGRPAGGPVPLRPVPAGVVLFRMLHPRQRPLHQYHGYKEGFREWLRSQDTSVLLIDTQPGNQGSTIDERGAK